LKIIFHLKNSCFKFLLTGVGCFLVASSFAQTEVVDTLAFFDNHPIFPYYHPNQPVNAKDFRILKKEFAAAITAHTDFDGIITIIFIINYKGETGFYKTQLTDLNYQPLEQNSAHQDLCGQLLKAVKVCGPWKPARDEAQHEINSRKFYSFKFVKGRLIEILPK